jgi:hypothetical protein
MIGLVVAKFRPQRAILPSRAFRVKADTLEVR